MLHKNAPLGDLHSIQNWEVADMTALYALSVTSADIGKVAKVLSPAGMFILVSNVGPAWGKMNFNPDYPDITVSATPPVSPNVNDIWFQIPA